MLYQLLSIGCIGMITRKLKSMRENGWTADPVKIEMILAEIFSSKSDPGYLSYYRDHIFNWNIIRNASIIAAYSKYLQLQDPKTIVSQCRWLHDSVNMMKEGSVRKQFYLRIIEDQLEHLKSLRQAENRSDEKRKLDSYIGTLQKLSRK